MLKQLSQLEMKIGNFVYQFLTEPNAPIVDIKEALFQFQKYVGMIEDSIKQQVAQQAQKSATSPIAEITKPEEPNGHQ